MLYCLKKIEKQTKKPSLGLCLFKLHYTDILLAGFLKFVAVLLKVIGPLILEY